mgnify:FL=1
MLEQEAFGTLLAEKITKTPEFKAVVSKIVNEICEDVIWDEASKLRIQAMKALGLDFVEDDGMELGMTCDGDLRCALVMAIAKEIRDF